MSIPEFFTLADYHKLQKISGIQCVTPLLFKERLGEVIYCRLEIYNMNNLPSVPITPSPVFSEKEVNKYIRIFWWLSVGLILFGLFWSYNLWSNLSKSDKVEGTVYGQQTFQGILNVSFSGPSNKILFVDLLCASSGHSAHGSIGGIAYGIPDCRDYPVGSQISVYYQSNNPQGARNIRLSTHLLYIILSLTSGVTLLVLLNKRKKTQII